MSYLCDNGNFQLHNTAIVFLDALHAPEKWAPVFGQVYGLKKNYSHEL